MPFHKISTPKNQVKLRYFTQRHFFQNTFQRLLPITYFRNEIFWPKRIMSSTDSILLLLFTRFFYSFKYMHRQFKIKILFLSIEMTGFSSSAELAYYVRCPLLLISQNILSFLFSSFIICYTLVYFAQQGSAIFFSEACSLHDSFRKSFSHETLIIPTYVLFLFQHQYWVQYDIFQKNVQGFHFNNSIAICSCLKCSFSSSGLL